MSEAAEEMLRPLDKVKDALGCSIYTVRRYIALGKIRAVHIGSRVMVSSAEIARVQREGLPAIPLPKKKAAESSDGEQKPQAHDAGPTPSTQPSRCTAQKEQ